MNRQPAVIQKFIQVEIWNFRSRQRIKMKLTPASAKKILPASA